MDKYQETINHIREDYKIIDRPPKNLLYDTDQKSCDILQELYDEYTEYKRLFESASKHTEMGRCLGCDNFMQCTNERCTRCLERIDGD